MAKKGGLGRGLDALFAENDSSSAQAQTLKISEIEPNKNQPRKDFDESALAQLAESISQHGVIQPLIVKPMTNGRYLLVAGERRWRASRMAGLSQVPVVIKELDDKQVAEISLIENLQREDLNPVEEALGYRELMDRFSLTQDEVSRRVGKSRPAVTNSLRLLTLPEDVLALLKSGRLSAGHARALLAVSDENELKAAAQTVVKKGLSVRETERLTGKKGKGSPADKSAREKAQSRETYFDEMQIALTEHLGRRVTVSGSGAKGVLQIEFYSKDELSSLAEKLTK